MLFKNIYLKPEKKKVLFFHPCQCCIPHTVRRRKTIKSYTKSLLLASSKLGKYAVIGGGGGQEGIETTHLILNNFFSFSNVGQL